MELLRVGGNPGARVRRAVALAIALTALAHLAPGGAARAVDSPGGGLPAAIVVSENAVDWTPHVLDGRVTAIARVGNRMVVGGRFSKVRQAGTKEVLVRQNLFAFDAETGVIDRGFVPNPDDKVSALVAAPGGDAVFVGGSFRSIAGQRKWALAKLDVPSGRLSDGFRAWVDRRVDDLVVSGNRLFVAGVVNHVNGVERSGLAAVDAGTGALDPGVDVRFTDPRNDLLVVNRIAVRRDGSRLVALGSFLRADGQDRPQLAVLDVDSGGARLADWHTGGYADRCSDEFDTYMRGVDISADGSWFVVVTTGGRARPLCDAVARFELDRTGQNIKPSWIDFSGGDTFTGVAVTDAAVYVGGHQRWMNNPFHTDTGITATPGIGSVPRPGIAALDPVNGLPLSWNPGRDPRGLGVFTFVATPEGLWIGSDTDNIGGEYHPRLALLPTRGGKTLPRPTPNHLPTTLYRRTAGPVVVPLAPDSATLPPAPGESAGVPGESAGVPGEEAGGRAEAVGAPGEPVRIPGEVVSFLDEADGGSGAPDGFGRDGGGAPDGAAAPAAATGVRLAAQMIDERGAGPEAALGAGLDWSQARAAFSSDGRLYIAWADGHIDSRPIDDAGGFGPPAVLDLGGLAEHPPAMLPVGRLTGAAFDAERGRIYYAIEGDPRLYYRYFTPESGVVGGLPLWAGGPGAGQDWSDVEGLAIADGHLYTARRGGAVQRFSFDDGRQAWSKSTIVEPWPTADSPQLPAD